MVAEELGITIHGTFILGLPGETLETIRETIEFAVDINPHTIQVSLAAPYPGTELYKQAVDNGWLPRKTPGVEPRQAARACNSRPCHYPNLAAGQIYGAVEHTLSALLFQTAKDRGTDGGNDDELGDDEAAAARGRRILPVSPRTRSLTRPLRRFLIVTADDFGLHEAVNEAVEQASVSGVLTAASLMVAAPAAADAIRRARKLPNLRTGLHLVLAGPALAVYCRRR